MRGTIKKSDNNQCLRNPNKTMGILYYIRHGETENNNRKIYTGQKDVELNKVGIRQAHDLGIKFKEAGVDLIISSPLLRAKKTANIINDYIGKEIMIDDRFKEVDLGVYDGLTEKQISEIIQTKYKNNNFAFYNDNSTWGENAVAAKKRVYEGLDNIKNKYSDKKILLITHGFIVRVINNYFNPKISFSKFFNHLPENAEIRKVTF